MDRKSNHGPRGRRRTRRGGSVSLRNVMPLNQTLIRGAWTAGALVSSTTGTISATFSPSIQNSSEYATLVSLYSEVKLVACTMTCTPLVPYDTTSTQSRIKIGYNMVFTDATHTDPTGWAEVNNLFNSRVLNSTYVVPTTFRAPIPRRLNFSQITQDSPTLSTPYAGSPGMFVVYGDGFTGTVGYWRVDMSAIWHLRGRA